MSVEAVHLVKSRRLGDVVSKAILLILADYADADWSSWASIQRIAAEAEVSRSTVKRRVDDLCSAGIVAVEARYRANGSQTSNRVTLVRQAIDSLPPTWSPSDADRDGVAAHPPVQADPPPGSQVNPPRFTAMTHPPVHS